jgi:hypothetical protein
MHRHRRCDVMCKGSIAREVILTLFIYLVSCVDTLYGLIGFLQLTKNIVENNQWNRRRRHIVSTAVFWEIACS